jgi:hypothetical protein
MIDRAWEIWKSIGGVALLIVVGIYLANSAHAGHALNRHEAWAALDRVTGIVIGEVREGVAWLSSKGR